MSMQQQPDMPPFSPAGWRGPVGAPSPISSCPPAPAPGQQQQLDELGAAASGSGSGSLDGHEGLAGEEGERGGSSSAGNRWPRQETLALLKIRSEMDAAFREAALKGPLWEDVSRRLAEMGYRRSAKKCREKFENVDKYYRRTKDGRAGRGDGKTYRFFSELEALHGAAASAHPPTPAAVAPPAAKVSPTTIGVSGPSAAPLPPPLVPQPQSSAPLRATETAACVMTVGDASFSRGSEGSDGEDTDETAERGKRKRRSWSGAGAGGGKAMRFFEGLMWQVMERQEAMQRRFLEAIERRDQDRMIREEAWRRQEVARLAREQDALAHERAVAASRDAAVVSFIQRVTGQIVPAPTSIHSPATITSLKPPPLQPTPVSSAAPAPPPSQHQQGPPVQAAQHVMSPMTTQPQTPKPHVTPVPTQPQTPQPQGKEVVRLAPEPQDTSARPGGCGGGASPSRWPKAEVHALIQLRTEMETRYQDAAPKGPLWEDISAGMRRLGYSRSAKRCKEKWENINKYFKKVKESSRKRPEDSKTCPYFHQLDALYRTKALATSGVVVSEASPRPEAAVNVLAAVPLSQTAPAHVEHVGKNCSNGNGNGNGCASNSGSSGGMQMKASNGGAAASFSSVEGAGNGHNGVATNKPLGSKQEGAAKERPATMNSSYGNDRRNDDDMDSDSMDDEEEDDFDEDDGGRHMQVQYDIHFQRQQHQHQQNNNVVLPNANGGGGNAPAGPAPTAAAATGGTPFLGMVQ